MGHKTIQERASDLELRVDTLEAYIETLVPRVSAWDKLVIKRTNKEQAVRKARKALAKKREKAAVVEATHPGGLYGI